MEGLGLSRCILWILLTVSSSYGSSKVPQLAVLERQKRQVYNPPEFVLGMKAKYNEGGPWGPWTINSSCSRSCGGGVSFQARICTSFRFDGTHTCFGPSKRYHSCNIQPCLDDTDFRLPQCTRFNSIPFHGKYHSWVPFYGAPNPCELNCMPKGSNYYHRRGRRVIDGTSCYNNGTNDICIDGRCISLPCDRILGSDTKVDKCGVCGGDDSTCHLISGIVDQEIYTVGYNDILLIPPNAVGIIIEEVTPNKNHFAVRDFTGQYYLNGNWQIEFSGTYVIGGAEFHYERNYDLSIPERLWSEGPTLEPLFISLVYQDPERNPGVKYEYIVPVDKEITPSATYSWKADEYQECSKTCSGGEQQRLVYCVRSKDNAKVEDSLCDIGRKPKQSKECNTQPCPATWHVGKWSQCSQSCASGIQYRLVYCEQIIQGGILAVTNDQQCEQDDKPKPPFFQTCNKDVECPRWHAGPWTACNRICGPGNQTREVTCEKGKQETIVLEHSSCDLEKIPDSIRICTVRPCEGVEWILTEWSGCTDKCGPHRESREAYCANEKGEVFSDDLCSDKPVPKLSRPCPKAKPCTALWHTSEWSRCSAKCGTGVQTREVFCGIWKGDSVRKVADRNCKKEKKFTTLRNCTRTPCKGSWFSGPWTKCSLPCGGGERTRKILCLHKDTVVSASQCDPSVIPHNNETCNEHSCREVTTTESTHECFFSPYGCCPDGKTIAAPNIECPTDVTEDCGPFGCCLDLKTPAQGPFRAGCPDITLCNETKYGCCPDGLTPAKGKLNQGCPGVSDCLFSTHGCCSDNITAAKGPDMQGCPPDNVTKTTSTVLTTVGTTAADTSAVPITVITTISETIDIPSKTTSTGTFIVTDVPVSTIPTTEISAISKTMAASTLTVTTTSSATKATTTDKKTTIVTVEDTTMTSTPATPTMTSTVTDVSSSVRETTTISDIMKTTTPTDLETKTSSAIESTMTSVIDVTASSLKSTMTSDITNTTILASKETTTTSTETEATTTSSAKTSIATESTIPTEKGTTSATETKMTSGITGTTTLTTRETLTSSETQPTTTSSVETSDATESITSAVTEKITTSTDRTITATESTLISKETLTSSSQTQTSATSSAETSHSIESTTTIATDDISSTAETSGTTESAMTSGSTETATSISMKTLTTSSETEDTSISKTDVTETIDVTGTAVSSITDKISTVSSSTPVSLTTATGTITESSSTEIMTSVDETKTTSSLSALSTAMSGSTTTATLGTSEPMTTAIMGTSEPMTTATTGTSESITATTMGTMTTTLAETTTMSGTITATDTTAITESKSSATIEVTTAEIGTMTTAESTIGSITTVSSLLNSTSVTSDTMPFSLTSSTMATALSDNETTVAGTLDATGTTMLDNSTDTTLLDNATSSVSCNETEFGCCPDNITASTDEDGSNCTQLGVLVDLQNKPQNEEPNDSTCIENPNLDIGNPECCENSQYGCCPDNVTTAIGEGFKGCSNLQPEELKKQSECQKFLHGCCPDGFTPSPDDNFIGCPCETFEYGCCEDNITPRLGPDDEGCCVTSEFGCCPDNKTRAEREDFIGCHCSTLEFGCCRDNSLPAIGPNQEGCECEFSIYECCEDGYTMPTGPDFEGCLCHEMIFGCCPDNFTAARGSYGEGCRCHESRYGCCPDEQTAAKGLEYFGCPCSTLTFGCCADGKTPAHDKEKRSCPCNTTEYGCCPNGITPATGPNNTGCPCETTKFGCCADGKTAAIGFYGAGCEDCTKLQYGCCPDNKTVAKGTNYDDCPCNTYPHGCCPDGKTPAQGPNNFGCSCGLYGCCPDGKTPAQGPNNYGCPCGVYGCCPDGKTPAQGPNNFGCPCGVYGCCPDGKTSAQGPNNYGCPCGVNGCCPDGKTPAKGPNNLGCSCGLYGCCPDGKTPAQGPNNTGCSCGIYGCCPDGLTPARELNGTDCPCNTLTFGCCPDNRTAAIGPNYFGCSCNTMQYGCCSDGITPAKGPNEAGCSCDSSQYGCCPDNHTQANGPNNKGCPCSSFPYGCCPDNHTIASGPAYAGCSCRTMLYGCCYDGVTPAKGPNYEGCPCNTSQYGCCQDGITPAAGDNYKGCACSNTYFGCCADGYTAASGPNYKGCLATDSTGPSTTERCSLVAERGPCYNYVVKWYFDTNLASCQRFWYGGCEGNANRFQEEKDCKDACVAPPDEVTESPTPTDICKLPKKEGNCMVAVLRWFYEYQSQNCQQFYYSGCEGNQNRFVTLAECEERCSPHKGRDICQMPLETGNCADFRERWWYDSTSAECKTFYYSGCGGNGNNFDSYTACVARCDKSAGTVHPSEEFKIEYCLLDKDLGPCPNNELRWYYDKSTGVCREFFYGGCQGNLNRFQSHRECETKCTDSQDICKLPQIRGNCNKAIVQWSYSHEENECREFLFTGCQGNANRFSEEEECEKRCKVFNKLTTVVPPSQDRCSLPKDPGFCVGQHTAWYYDTRLNRCRKFIYGGCDGNDNRFSTRKNCELLCVKKIPKEKPTVEPHPENNDDVCRMPPERGDCDQVLRQWFYDASSKMCLPFIYSGCGGNKNHFKTEKICIKFCSGISSEHVPDMKTTEQSCPQSNCDELRCPLGKDEKVDGRGCVYCQCFNPCEIHVCSEDSRCAIEMYRTTDGEPRAQPLCRLINKPGQCPTVESKAADPYSSDCIERCRLDSDCRDDRKCCFNGCTNICMDPISEIVDSTHHFDHPTEQDIVVKVGEPVFLVCPAIPSMSYHWSRNNASLPDDDPHIEILHNGTVYIASAEEHDASIFVCTTPGSSGTHIQHKFNLVVQAQARILPGPILVLVQLAQPATLLCKAIGYPQPIVTWWREQRMLPVSSSRYQQYPDHTLLIRSVAFSDAGIYTCQAYNGIGPIAVLAVTVRFSHSSDISDSLDFNNKSDDTHHYNESGGDRAHEIVPTTSPKSTTVFSPRRNTEDATSEVVPISVRHSPSPTPIEGKAEIIGESILFIHSGNTLNLTCVVTQTSLQPNFIFWYHNGTVINHDSGRAGVSIQTQTSPLTKSILIITNIQPTDSGNYSCAPSNADQANIVVHVLFADLSVEISEVTPTPKIGNLVQLDCIANGPPSLTVTWYFNNSLIQENDRIRILQNNTLIISDIQTSHSGHYQCVARDNLNEASASITVAVKDDIPEDCIDNPVFTNCELLVKAKYCANQIYARYCCRSCTLAGQPPKS